MAEPLPRNTLLRMYFCLGTVLSATTGLVDPDSLAWHLVQEVGQEARWLAVGLVVMSAAGLMDTVLNDMLPPQWSFKWACKHRTTGYMVIAAIYSAFILIAVLHEHTSLLLLRYLLDCIICVWIAAADVWHRFMKPRQDSKSWAA